MNDLFPLRAPNLASRTLAGEAIIMKPSDSSLFSLNETATAIWLAADGKTSLRQIVETELCGNFEIEPRQALDDAEELVRGLADHGILLLLPEPA